MLQTCRMFENVFEFQPHGFKRANTYHANMRLYTFIEDLVTRKKSLLENFIFRVEITETHAAEYF